jgi:hypothetical protein
VRGLMEGWVVGCMKGLVRGWVRLRGKVKDWLVGIDGFLIEWLGGQIMRDW